jgi:hypothetical protein
MLKGRHSLMAAWVTPGIARARARDEIVEGRQARLK